MEHSVSPTILEPPSPAHQTGEQPAVFSEKSRFTYPVVVALIAATLAAAGGIARATSAEECCRAATATQHQHDLRLQRTEDAQAAQSKALERIEQKLDQMIEERRKP